MPTCLSPPKNCLTDVLRTRARNFFPDGRHDRSPTCKVDSVNLGSGRSLDRCPPPARHMGIVPLSHVFFIVKELSFVYIANLVPKGNEFGILTKIKKESHSRTSLKRPQVKYMVKVLVWSQLSIYPSLYAAERLSSDAA